MMVSNFVFFGTPHIAVPEGASAGIQVLLRWVHFIAGITWVGLLYFFNLVNIPFMKEIDATTRAKVVPTLLPRALWWFRWASVVTVFAGIWYWMMIVTSDAHNAQTSGGMAIGSFFALWTAAFAVEMGAVMSGFESLRKGAIFGSIVGVAVAGAAYLYLSINSHGWESNRMLCIGVGGGIGWFMLLNVWGLLWRAQKKIIRWTAESAANQTQLPAEAASLARISFLVSRTNFVLSFPMLFFMAAASHYPIL